MKKHLLTLLILATLAALAWFVAAPAADRYQRQQRQAAVVSDYYSAADALSPLECGTLLSQARSYNDALASGSGALSEEAYTEALNPTGSGVMAVLEIPKLGRILPVYHSGALEDGAAGVAHDAGSSLPAGDAALACALYARAGEYEDPLSTLPRLISGDVFYLHVLQSTLTFEVYQVAELPEGTEAELALRSGQDECVLIGEADADGQRLAARGRRVPRRSLKPTDDSRTLPDWAAGLILAVPIAAAGLVLLTVIEWLRKRIQRHRRRRMKL